MDEMSPTALDRLSVRQRQCLEFVADGYTSKEIGRRLGVSPSTVDNHIRTALARLNISDRAEAARQFRNSQQSALIEMPVAPISEVSQQSFFRLPPLGGSPNNLSMQRRIWHIVQIALIGIMGMTAAVITIAGLVNLFSER